MTILPQIKILLWPFRRGATLWRKDRRYRWVFAGAFALLLRMLFGMFPGLTETVYARGLYQGIRYLVDYTIGWSPLPLFHVSVLLLIAWGLILVYRAWRKRRAAGGKPWRKRFASFTLSFFAFLGGVTVLFFGMWGFNYNRVPVAERLGLNMEPLEGPALLEEAEHALFRMTIAREAIGLAEPDQAIPEGAFPEDLDDFMRDQLAQALLVNGYPAPGRVRVKKLHPGGILMNFGVTGIYIPFLTEGYIAGDLPALSQPFTIAHEMAHAMGFGDEGTCNFWGLLACLRSSHPVVRYCGWLSYWRYLAPEVYRSSKSELRKLYAQMPKGIRADLKVIRNYGKSYSGVLRKVGSKVNNVYLKSQGVKEGVKSYNMLLVLFRSYRLQSRQIVKMGRP